MTPAQRLQAAIEKLERAKEATAHWHAIGGASEWVMLLWRTLDAQLAILRFGVKRQEAVDWTNRLANREGDLQFKSAELELALADAILGSDQ